jgi:type 1 fimbriae regulatory protein FimB/type 1 fimbriae regulatory protein FimE
MAKPNLKLVPPPTKNGTVGKAQPPARPKNADLREREHLRPEEVERLIEAARSNRHGNHDALMVLMSYRHGLRASEVTDLKWEQVDFDRAEIHVNRLKGGTPATHPLTGREMRELRRHRRESPQAPFVFVSERGAPLTPPGFNRMVKRAAIAADLGIKAHAHMLRHACGYKLANDGHDTRAIQAYLGHRNIQNTTRYTALAPQRFKEFFRD